MPIQRFIGCVAWDPQLYKGNEYGYRPNLAPGVVFVACFALSLGLHVFQTCRKRTWWTFVFAVGALSKYHIALSTKKCL